MKSCTKSKKKKKNIISLDPKVSYFSMGDVTLTRSRFHIQSVRQTNLQTTLHPMSQTIVEDRKSAPWAFFCTATSPAFHLWVNEKPTEIVSF